MISTDDVAELNTSEDADTTQTTASVEGSGDDTGGGEGDNSGSGDDAGGEEPEDPEVEARREEASKLAAERLQRAITATMLSRVSLAPRGTRICVVAEREIPFDTRIDFPGAKAQSIPSQHLMNMFTNMRSSLLEQTGEDVDFASWYFRTYGRYEKTEPGMSVMYLTGFHSVDMAQYVKRTDVKTQANCEFADPRVLVALRDVAPGEELVALVSKESADAERARQSLRAEMHRKHGSKQRRRAKIKARKAKQKEEKKLRKAGLKPEVTPEVKPDVQVKPEAATEDA